MHHQRQLRGESSGNVKLTLENVNSVYIKGDLDWNVIQEKLNSISRRYSNEVIDLVIEMLEEEEKNRSSFKEILERIKNQF